MKIATTLPEVSSICKKASWCKSHVLPDGTFSVETWNTGEGDDPRRVWIEENVDPENKFDHFERLLQRSDFFTELDKACRKKSPCKVVIKPNISIAVQKRLLNYTDPELVNWLVDRLKRKGHDDVMIVESQNAFTLIRDDHEPTRIAKNIGYTEPVVNLSVEPMVDVPYKEGKITVSPIVRDADFVINFPKGRNHTQRKMTAAVKNMYGAIPDMNKLELYHWKENGVSMEDAAVAVNHSTPSDFTILDMIHTIDGEDEHVSMQTLEKHVSPKILMAGKDPLAMDKALALKMGYEQNEPPVDKAEADFRGDFDIRERGLVDGSLDVIRIDGKPWKKPVLGGIMTFVIDDLLKNIIKMVPIAREGAKMVGNYIKFDVT